MFFPERVKSIKATDRVLEVGPGGTPHPRSDIFLEYEFDSLDIAASQRANAEPLKTDKPVIFYKGELFPFKDKEFDYIICSHVAEHIQDLDRFVAEVTRVGKAGYFEYPTIYYDYMYNIPDHLTFVKRKGNTLYWMNKKDTNLSEFQLVQNFFYHSLTQKHYDLVNNLKDFFFEGFEWVDSIPTLQTLSLQDLIFETTDIPIRKPSLISRIRGFSFARILNKLKKQR